MTSLVTQMIVAERYGVRLDTAFPTLTADVGQEARP